MGWIDLSHGAGPRDRRRGDPHRIACQQVQARRHRRRRRACRLLPPLPAVRSRPRAVLHRGPGADVQRPRARRHADDGRLLRPRRRARGLRAEDAAEPATGRRRTAAVRRRHAVLAADALACRTGQGSRDRGARRARPRRRQARARDGRDRHRAESLARQGRRRETHGRGPVPFDVGRAHVRRSRGSLRPRHQHRLGGHRLVELPQIAQGRRRDGAGRHPGEDGTRRRDPARVPPPHAGWLDDRQSRAKRRRCSTSAAATASPATSS